MTVKRLVLWITFLSVFAMAARVSMDTDTWWHLRTGEWILEHGALPRTDPFSYTRQGEPWRIPGWLVQVPMAWMYRAGGPGALNLWVAAMVVLAFALLYPVLDGGVFLKAFVVILAAASAGVYWAARPYMVTFVLTAAFLHILEGWRSRRSDSLLWLPFLMIVWANSHGGFAAGLILVGVYLAGALVKEVEHRVRRRGEAGAQPVVPDARLVKLLLVFAASVAAVAISPAGPSMILYPFKTVSISSLQDFIQEWQSPNFHERQLWPFAALLFLTLGAVGVSGKRLRLEEFLLVSGWGFMGLLAGRNIAIFSLAASLVLARHTAPAVRRWSGELGIDLRPGRSPSRMLGALNAVLAGLIVLAAGLKAASVVPRAVNEIAFQDLLPVEAAAFIAKEQPGGQLFNSYNWGAYLLWALPEYPVFIDGRTDLYDDELIETWFTVVRAEQGWEGILERWGVNLILLEPHTPVTRALEEAGWRLLYSDPVAVVYGR